MIPKHPLHVYFDEDLAEIFEVKDNWYHFKIEIHLNFNCFFGYGALPLTLNILVISSSNSKIRILNPSLILEIDEEMTKIFKVIGKAQAIKVETKLNFEVVLIVFNLKYLSQNFI